MYESYYHLTAKPFQLKPDPKFFFGSRNHKRAMAYLQYGLSQGEGFIVITGEVGAGKTTLVRNLFRDLDTEEIVAAQIVNTHLSSEDTLKMVAAAFGIPFEDASKAVLLTRIEQFLRTCDQQGKRALLVVDEAQNLSSQTVEELRMLSNFQTNDNSLLQTFLLGQPEFRKTLLSADMLQLRQRVIASYHLGPMGIDETRTYIEHRLHTVGWRNDPSLSDDAYSKIHEFTGGIPRKINTLCDRLFLMGYLEEIHAFDKSHVDTVIQDIQQEFNHSDFASDGALMSANLQSMPARSAEPSLEYIIERLGKIERATQFVVDAVTRLLFSSKTQNTSEELKS
jgi:putative secretion ATPase (PEP-CTERM system associated)